MQEKCGGIRIRSWSCRVGVHASFMGHDTWGKCSASTNNQHSDVDKRTPSVWLAPTFGVQREVFSVEVVHL